MIRVNVCESTRRLTRLLSDADMCDSREAKSDLERRGRGAILDGQAHGYYCCPCTEWETLTQVVPTVVFCRRAKVEHD